MAKRKYPLFSTFSIEKEKKRIKALNRERNNRVTLRYYSDALSMGSITADKNQQKVYIYGVDLSDGKFSTYWVSKLELSPKRIRESKAELIHTIKPNLEFAER